MGAHGGRSRQAGPVFVQATTLTKAEKDRNARQLFGDKKALFGGIDTKVLVLIHDDPNGYWNSGNGRIHVSSMDNEHLYNSIRYLARTGRRSLMLEAEADKRYEQFLRNNAVALSAHVEPHGYPGRKLRNIIRD